MTDRYKVNRMIDVIKSGLEAIDEETEPKVLSHIRFLNRIIFIQQLGEQNLNLFEELTERAKREVEGIDARDNRGEFVDQIVQKIDLKIPSKKSPEIHRYNGEDIFYWLDEDGKVIYWYQKCGDKLKYIDRIN